jgi:hypothetical protein
MCNISMCLVPCGPIPFNKQPNFFVDRIINNYINSLKILGKKFTRGLVLGCIYIILIIWVHLFMQNRNRMESGDQEPIYIYKRKTT